MGRGRAFLNSCARALFRLFEKKGEEKTVFQQITLGTPRSCYIQTMVILFRSELNDDYLDFTNEMKKFKRNGKSVINIIENK